MSGLEIVGLILAGPGIVKLFFDIAETILGKMKNNKKLKDYARDLGKFMIDDGRAQLTRDFELARGILKDQNTRTVDKDRINQLFNGALGQLEHMNDFTNIVLNSGTWDFRKRSAALREIKDKITSIGTSMSEFHQLVMILHTTAISESPLFLEDQDFALVGPEQDYSALNTAAFVARGRVSQLLSPTRLGDGRFLLESKPYMADNRRSVKKDLRILSQKLAAAGQNNGILPLVGFRDNSSRNEFQLVFGIPSAVGSLQTLESLYASAEPKPSLNTRINLCCWLAEAVLQTHKLGLVHKNIRPENVLLSSISYDINRNEPFLPTFLSGWHYARSVDSKVTSLVGEDTWQRAIYQHPERLGKHVDDEYCMGHDIYSLGVCMLEILLWDPLIITTGDGDLQEASVCQSFTTIFDQHEQGQEAQQVSSDMERLTQIPKTVQRTLLHMTETLIPAAAGGRMKGLVCQCLTCLDAEASLGLFNVSQEREDKDVAVGFVDTVLKDICQVMSAI
ncbi:hypothetical protein GP486_001548 [Trichoglossum hirsutum]|uniref:Protein kinase domain-containing protein n=1 Tax=Trichoglossum hirsutum TaxID=265104 RepID=A0A9P8RSL0_9PEZI|nr:hypothetical protein GP486_001548 [Trichoglossum hirsutum]